MSDSPRRVLRRLDARPKQSLGQNFCVDQNILAKIVRAARIEPEDTVVEIGAGTGAMTGLLSDTGCTLHAVEIDRRLQDELDALFGQNPRVNLHYGDALELLPEILGSMDRPVIVMGNLPYNISSQVVFRLLEQPDIVREAVLTFQWELAARLASPPGNKEYGALSVLVQAAAAVALLFKIKPASFFPVPKVDSACVRFDFSTPIQPAPCEKAMFKQVVKGAFGQRRKQLRNALFAVFPQDRVMAALDRAKIAPSLRAEALSVEEFVRLADAFTDLDRT